MARSTSEPNKEWLQGNQDPNSNRILQHHFRRRLRFLHLPFHPSFAFLNCHKKKCIIINLHSNTAKRNANTWFQTTGSKFIPLGVRPVTLETN